MQRAFSLLLVFCLFLTACQRNEEVSEVTPESMDATETATELLTEPAVEDEGQNYVLNTNTMKFHYPSCSSIGQMKSSNKEYYCGTREALIEQGYAPCGRCHP